MEILRPRWSSASFLLYAGGLIVLAAASQSLGILGDAYHEPGFVGWSLVVFVPLLLLAVGFRRSDRPIAAGVFAFAAVVAWAVLVGAVEQWFGWLPHAFVPFEGFHLGVLLLALLTLAAARVALRVFRFPLIVTVVLLTAWYFVMDVVSNGGSWSAVVTFLIGLAYLARGASLDRGAKRPLGFWFHVAAGLAIGGSLLYFWHTTTANWALVAVAGVVFVGFAGALGRSSWAVLGGYGLYLSASHFVLEWAGYDGLLQFFPLSLLSLAAPFGVNQDLFDDRHTHLWAAPLTYAFLGFLLVALGLLLERGRRTTAAS